MTKATKYCLICLGISLTYLFLLEQSLSAPHEDFYDILGIQRTATDDEIKRAYRKLSIQYHPDRIKSTNPEHKKAATDKFIKISQAYEILKDADKRKQYDMNGSDIFFDGSDTNSNSGDNDDSSFDQKSDFFSFKFKTPDFDPFELFRQSFFGEKDPENENKFFFEEEDPNSQNDDLKKFFKDIFFSKNKNHNSEQANDNENFEKNGSSSSPFEESNMKDYFFGKNSRTSKSHRIDKKDISSNEKEAVLLRDQMNFAIKFGERNSISQESINTLFQDRKSSNNQNSGAFLPNYKRFLRIRKLFKKNQLDTILIHPTISQLKSIRLKKNSFGNLDDFLIWKSSKEKKFDFFRKTFQEKTEVLDLLSPNKVNIILFYEGSSKRTNFFETGTFETAAKQDPFKVKIRPEIGAFLGLVDYFKHFKGFMNFFRRSVNTEKHPEENEFFTTSSSLTNGRFSVVCSFNEYEKSTKIMKRSVSFPSSPDQEFTVSNLINFVHEKCLLRAREINIQEEQPNSAKKTQISDLESLELFENSQNSEQNATFPLGTTLNIEKEMIIPFLFNEYANFLRKSNQNTEKITKPKMRAILLSNKKEPTTLEKEISFLLKDFLIFGHSTTCSSCSKINLKQILHSELQDNPNSKFFENLGQKGTNFVKRAIKKLEQKLSKDNFSAEQQLPMLIFFNFPSTDSKSISKKIKQFTSSKNGFNIVTDIFSTLNLNLEMISNLEKNLLMEVLLKNTILEENRRSFFSIPLFSASGAIFDYCFGKFFAKTTLSSSKNSVPMNKECLVYSNSQLHEQDSQQFDKNSLFFDHLRVLNRVSQKDSENSKKDAEDYTDFLVQDPKRVVLIQNFEILRELMCSSKSPNSLFSKALYKASKSDPKAFKDIEMTGCSQKEQEIDDYLMEKGSATKNKFFLFKMMISEDQNIEKTRKSPKNGILSSNFRDFVFVYNKRNSFEKNLQKWIFRKVSNDEIQSEDTISVQNFLFSNSNSNEMLYEKKKDRKYPQYEGFFNLLAQYKPNYNKKSNPIQNNEEKGKEFETNESNELSEFMKFNSFLKNNPKFEKFFKTFKSFSQGNEKSEQNEEKPIPSTTTNTEMKEKQGTNNLDFDNFGNDLKHTNSILRKLFNFIEKPTITSSPKVESSEKEENPHQRYQKQRYYRKNGYIPFISSQLNQFSQRLRNFWQEEDFYRLTFLGVLGVKAQLATQVIVFFMFSSVFCILHYMLCFPPKKNNLKKEEIEKKSN